jgi:hypothetical protein
LQTSTNNKSTVEQDIHSNFSSECSSSTPPTPKCQDPSFCLFQELKSLDTINYNTETASRIMIETYLLMLAQLQTKGIARGYLYFMKNFAEQIQSVFMDLSKDCTQDTFIKQRISLQQKLKFLWMGAYNNSVGFEQIETKS